MKTWKVQAVSAASALLLAACGGGGSDAGDSEGSARETAQSAGSNAQGDGERGGLFDRHGPVDLTVLSSPPQYVSGGDARIAVRVPPGLRDKLELRLNGRLVRGALAPTADGLEGVITGLVDGRNVLEVRHKHLGFLLRDRLVLTNYPITGPIFSTTGPRPWLPSWRVKTRPCQSRTSMSGLISVKPNWAIVVASPVSRRRC